MGIEPKNYILKEFSIMETNEAYALVIKTEDIVKLGATALIGEVLAIGICDGIRELYKKFKSKKEQKTLIIDLRENEES